MDGPTATTAAGPPPAKPPPPQRRVVTGAKHRRHNRPDGHARRSLVSVVDQLGKRAKGVTARPPFMPPTPAEPWLVERLVFSQFIGFLGRVRARLDAEGVSYCYLDGKTRNRAAVLEQFKSGGAPVFLISLKAGGFGLNLTEADYCFLLDPRWNPATEAQAVDRTHRIGQTKNVMVYRLIAKDTIEEKGDGAQGTEVATVLQRRGRRQRAQLKSERCGHPGLFE